jgi:hypothetical protein
MPEMAPPVRPPNPLATATAAPAAPARPLPPRPPNGPPPVLGPGGDPAAAAEMQTRWAEGAHPAPPPAPPPDLGPMPVPHPTPVKALEPPVAPPAPAPAPAVDGGNRPPPTTTTAAGGGGDPPPAPGVQTAPAPAPEQKAEPVKGTREAEMQRLQAAASDMTPEAKAARLEQLKKESELYNKENVEKSTADMDPAKAEQQRTTDARKKLMEMEALGMSASDARALMDPRVLKEVDNQQKMVDDLAKKNAGLSKEQQQCALDAAALREKQKKDPSSVSEADRKALIERMGGQAALDAMPPETRLLMNGFSPDDIADHFTARDKDADVIRDSKNPTANTDMRGQGALADTARDKYTGGDVNENGSVRRPMTVAEADRTIDMNAVLDESWHAGNTFGKIVPNATVGNMQQGKDSWRDSKTGEAGGGTRGIALTGDIGERMNTDQEKDPTKRADAQVAAAGLDYPGSPYVERDPSGKVVRKDEEVHRVEGTINQELQNNAEVQVGHGVMARAQQRSQELAAAQASNPDVYVPKMLRRDSAGDTDSKDHMPGISERSRMGQTDPTSQTDPRTGLGYSVTEAADMGTVPNQERKMKSAMSFNNLDQPVNVTRSDRPDQTDLTYDRGSGTFKPGASLPTDVRADYDQHKTDAETRVSEAAENERKKKEKAEADAAAARAAASAGSTGATPGPGTGST